MRAAALLPRRPDADAPPIWRDRLPDQQTSEDQSALLEICGKNPLLAQILSARGIDPAAARTLLAGNDAAAAMSDPYGYADMGRAVARLQQAAAAHEACVVFGDYDVDGLTGTAILTEAFGALGMSVRAVLPHRLHDGYGIAPHHVESISASGVRLLVTVDCGANAHAAVTRAAQRGVDVIVIDHHPLDQWPPVRLEERPLAEINPHRADNGAVDAHLCGAGMAYTVLRALVQAGATLDLSNYLDLVALGTVADVVPLRGDNRILVRRGLTCLAMSKRPGIRALLEVSDVSRLTLGPRDIGFGLGPRLNAAGRLGDAMLGLDLLQAPVPRIARPLARQLDAINTERQALTRTATEEAITSIDAAGSPGPLIVVWNEHWHCGVVGLVASRLVERYRCPAVVIGCAGGRWRGSARSVAGFDIGAALARCEGLLLRHGGHTMAAGLEADEARLPDLRRELVAYAGTILGEADCRPTLMIDAHVAATALDWNIAEVLAALHPCGAEWPEPLLAIHEAIVLECRPDGGVLRLTIAGQGGMAINALIRPELLPSGSAQQGNRLDLAAVPVVRDKNGYRCLELDVHDARICGASVGTTMPVATVTV